MKDSSLISVNELANETITSQEVAELTGKRHADVLRDIRNITNQLEDEDKQRNYTFSFIINDLPNGGKKELPICYLTKKGCLCLASGYNANLRMKIINRWEELESNLTTIDTLISNPDFAIKLLTNLKEEREQRQEAEVKVKCLEQKVAEQEPDVSFSNAVKSAQSSCLVGELAKFLTQAGIPFGQNGLFKWLRDNHYLGVKGEYYNIPMQQYMEQGLFEIKRGVRTDKDGVIHHTSTVKVTGKGQAYFVQKFLANKPLVINDKW